ncbi:MAG TPA: PilN domain-containing protein [Terriglobales bacterium]|jgi:Tfp pilus assembly protein PilN
MIKINLLGVAKAKNKRGGGSSPVMESSGPGGTPTIKILIVLVFAGLLNFGYWYNLNRQSAAIDVQMKAAEVKNRQLADVKAEYLREKQEADNYQRRVDVIDTLRKNQTGPVNLLDTVGTTVNGTEAVWLSKMDDTGPNLNIQGMALSTDAVANLITNLNKTGYFRNIEIKETYQDEQVKDMQAFQFTLTCEKAKS